jgi:hybrid cluster-associated redox disulfide protein
VPLKKAGPGVSAGLPFLFSGVEFALITRKTTIGEIVKKNPAAVQPLLEIGFHCVGCPASSFESIEDGAKAHGLNDKQIDELVKKMNAAAGLK